MPPSVAADIEAPFPLPTRLHRDAVLAGDHATRAVLVSGLSMSTAAVASAVNATVSALGAYHNVVTDLPLAGLDVHQHEDYPGVAFVSVGYARRYWPRRPGQIPTPIVTALARTERVTAPVKWYKSFAGITAAGRPNGDPENWALVETNPNREPRPWHWHAPAVRIIVPTVLTAHPGQYCGGLIGKVNNAQVTWISTSWTMAASSLLFVAPHVQEVMIGRTASDIRYEVAYEFIYRPDTWQEQSVAWNTTTKKWEISDVASNASAAFTATASPSGTCFPVHAL